MATYPGLILCYQFIPQYFQVWRTILDLSWTYLHVRLFDCLFVCLFVCCLFVGFFSKMYQNRFLRSEIIFGPTLGVPKLLEIFTAKYVRRKTILMRILKYKSNNSKNNRRIRAAVDVQTMGGYPCTSMEIHRSLWMSLETRIPGLLVAKCLSPDA